MATKITTAPRSLSADDAARVAAIDVRMLRDRVKVKRSECARLERRVGPALRQLRMVLGLSLDDAAAFLGVSKAEVARIETMRGQVAPHEYNAERAERYATWLCEQEDARRKAAAGA